MEGHKKTEEHHSHSEYHHENKMSETEKHHTHSRHTHHHEHHKSKPYHTHSEHGEHHKKGLSRSFYTKINFVLGIALILFALFNILQVSSFEKIFDEKLEEAKIAAIPAKIEMTTITSEECEDCYDISAVVRIVESTGVNITKSRELDFSSKEAKSLIDKYGIEKLPTVILTGELNKSRSFTFKLKDIGEEKQGAYIFTQLEPPFVEASTGKIRGKVSLIHLKKDDCEDCFDLTQFITQLEKSGVILDKQEEIDIDSDEGKKLIGKYAIRKVPAIIMDQEAEVYPNIEQAWDKVGTIEEDGSYVMRELNPPYYSIAEDRIIGLVSMTILKDKTCFECYDPNEFHKPILERMGIVFGEEKEIEYYSKMGIILAEKYNIEKIPTIILEGDVEEYPALVQAWEGVGTVEDNGAYIFRKVEVAGQTYRDLSKGEIVDPTASS